MPSATWLFLSLIPSGVGFVLFMYGKKYDHWPQIIAGGVLMVYPYFATTLASLVGGAALIAAAYWWAVRSGW